MAASTSSTHSGDPAGVPADLSTTSGEGGLSLSAASSRAVGTLPLLDPTALEALTEDLGVPGISVQFAHDYAAMWGQRQALLRESVEQEDLAGALDAVISLKVTSTMVGGSRLAHLARTLEAALRQGDLRQVPALLSLIAVHGRDTIKELQRRHGLPAA